MGLFFPNYNKPGPGVPKDAPEKNRFFLFFELFFANLSNMIAINFVYMLTMLPLIFGVVLSVNFSKFPFVFTGDIIGLLCIIISIFTSFPVTAGFTFVLRNLQRREHAWIIRDMFKHTKLNYKKGVINGIVQLAAYTLFYVAFITYRYNIGGQLGIILSMFILIMTLIFIWMQYYVNIMIVTFDMTLMQIYKNALIFAIGRLPINLLLTVVCIALILGISYFPVIGFILSVLIAFSLLGFITVFWVYPTIDRTMIQKSKQTDETEPDEDNV